MKTTINLSKYLAKGIRYDGRKFLEYRKVTVEPGIAANADGSARVKIGETEVIAGVKMEIGTPYPDTPDKGSMMVNVELLPLSSPDFESGPPSEYAIELARVVDRGIRESEALDVRKLCIVEKEKAWIVVIDICTINDDGNLFDAISLATISAIKNTKFPAVDEDYNLDYKNRTDKGVELKKTPIEVTVFKIGKDLIVDPSPDEEAMMDARLTVAVTEDNGLCALQKGGNDGLSVDEIMTMVNIAIEKSQELRKLL